MIVKLSLWVRHDTTAQCDNVIVSLGVGLGLRFGLKLGLLYRLPLVLINTTNIITLNPCDC